ncbi:MAG: hypothetical protein AAGG59_18065 [Bacteroidota bacterium]
MRADQHRLLQYLFITLSGAIYIYLSYFAQRYNGVPLIFSFALLFLFYWYTYQKAIIQWKQLILISLLFRLLLLFSIPNLSDDIYRFIWDGKLLGEGIHPFAHLPSWFVNNDRLPESLDLSLYNRLNSPDYFTIYPPFAQLVFWLSAHSNSIIGSAVIIRLFIIGAEVISIFFLTKVCESYNIPKKHVLLYALNPLVILELTGNLHLEAFMIAFVVLGIYFYKARKPISAGVVLALAVAAKLVPLVLLPTFLRRLSFKKLILLFSSILIFLIILFWPLYEPALVKGMTESISLYFQKFEFNASIYYLVREIGFYVKGYNIIGIAGPWLSMITFILIIAIALLANSKKVSTPTTWLWILFTYFAFATIVHPWYATSLVALSVLTTFRFPIVWSGLIFLSYLGYSETGFKENMLVVILEYGLLYIFMIYELYNALGKRDLFKKKKLLK